MRHDLEDALWGIGIWCLTMASVLLAAWLFGVVP